MSRLLSNRPPRTRKSPLFNLLSHSEQQGCQVANPDFCDSVIIYGKRVYLLGDGMLAGLELQFKIWFGGFLGVGVDV